MNKNSQLTDHLFTVVDLLEKTGNQVFSHYGLTVKTCTILQLIHHGCDTNSKLLKVMSGSPAAITQKTKVLEQLGLIKRVLGQDKRQWIFSLTKKGEKIAKQSGIGHDLAADELYEPFSEKDKEIVLKFLQAVEQRLSYALETNYLAKQFNPKQ